MTHSGDGLGDPGKAVTPGISLGTTGLKHHAGIIDEEFLVRLRGQNAIKTYREMKDNSPTIASALNIIKILVRQVDWRVNPADESDAAKIEAEDTEQSLEDMSHTFEDFIAEIMSMLWAGFAPFEIIYKLRRGVDQEDGAFRSKMNDGKWGWRRIEIRGQETVDRWVFDEEGGLNGMWQLDMYAAESGMVFIPIEKMLLFRPDMLKGNPEGRSLLRPATIPYWYVKRIQEFEAIGVERNLAGMPMMEVPSDLLLPDASPAAVATRRALEDFITGIRVDERWGGLIPSEVKPDGSPSGFKFKLIQNSQAGKAMDTDIIIKRYRSEMLMLFLAQFLIMGTEKVGSFALASNMTNLFATSLGTVMDSIASVINRFMIPRRQRLNGIAPDLDPYITHGDLEGPDLDKIGKYIQSLSSSGMISPNIDLEKRLLEIGNLPQPAELEDPDVLSDNIIDDTSSQSLTSEQIQTILEVNRALKKKEVDHETAVAMVAAALSITEEAAERFVKAESNEPPPPMPPPGFLPPIETPETPEDDDAPDLEGDPEDEID